MNTVSTQVLWLLIITIFKLTFAKYRELTIERLNMVYLDKSIADVNYTINRISRTDYGITVYLNLFKEEINDEDTIVLQLYTFHSNEYRLAPVRIIRKTCQFLDMEWKFINHNIGKYGTLPTSCPIYKGLYYIKDFIVDASTMPDLPWDNMRCDVNFTKNGQTTAALQVFIKIDRNSKFINKYFAQL